MLGRAILAEITLDRIMYYLLFILHPSLNYNSLTWYIFTVTKLGIALDQAATSNLYLAIVCEKSIYLSIS